MPLVQGVYASGENLPVFLFTLYYYPRVPELLLYCSVTVNMEAAHEPLEQQPLLLNTS